MLVFVFQKIVGMVKEKKKLAEKQARNASQVHNLFSPFKGRICDQINSWLKDLSEEQRGQVICVYVYIYLDR